MSIPKIQKQKPRIREVAPAKDLDDFISGRVRAGEIAKKKEEWLLTQPREIQELSKKLDHLSPKEVLAYVRGQLTENVFVVSAYKNEIFWAVIHAMELARQAGNPKDMMAGAKLMMKIESDSIGLLKGMDKSSFEITGENIQVNFADNGDRDKQIKEAEESIARYSQVVGGGAIPLDREELEDTHEDEGDSPLRSQ